MPVGSDYDQVGGDFPGLLQDVSGCRAFQQDEFRGQFGLRQLLPNSRQHDIGIGVLRVES